jgi:hypothetical protein
MAAVRASSAASNVSASASVSARPGSITSPQPCCSTSRAISPFLAVMAITGRPAQAMP